MAETATHVPGSRERTSRTIVPFPAPDGPEMMNSRPRWATSAGDDDSESSTSGETCHEVFELTCPEALYSSTRGDVEFGHGLGGFGLAESGE